MGGPLDRLRGLYLSTGVERPSPVRGPGGWRFHLALGRTEVGSVDAEPRPRPGGDRPRTGGRAAPPRRAHPRVGDHPGPPNSHAAVIGRGLRAGRWRSGCSATAEGFPRVELADGLLARPVVLVRHAVPFERELEARTVPVRDPEPHRPVPGSPLPWTAPRRRAVRRHVASLSSSLGLVLDLRLDGARGLRLHPDGRVEVLDAGGGRGR